jgi:hypothetical protein
MYKRRLRVINNRLKKAKIRKIRIQNQKIYKMMHKNEVSFKKAQKKRRKRKLYMERGGQ